MTNEPESTTPARSDERAEKLLAELVRTATFWAQAMDQQRAAVLLVQGLFWMMNDGKTHTETLLNLASIHWRLDADLAWIKNTQASLQGVIQKYQEAPSEHGVDAQQSNARSVH